METSARGINSNLRTAIDSGITSTGRREDDDSVGDSSDEYSDNVLDVVDGDDE